MSDWHDVENNLAFPPQDIIEDVFLDIAEKFKKINKQYQIYKSLSENGQSVIDTNKRLKEKIEWEISKNNALERQLIEAKEEIERGRKALGLMCDSNDELSAVITGHELEEDYLRGLLKECKERIHDEFINQDIVSIDNFHELLTKINKVLEND